MRFSASILGLFMMTASSVFARGGFGSAFSSGAGLGIGFGGTTGIINGLFGSGTRYREREDRRYLEDRCSDRLESMQREIQNLMLQNQQLIQLLAVAKSGPATA